ncbi:S10 family serine carboxypeptidase-like protein [Phyllobacterium bourgognense]|uniref:Carboxypeptidase C (Cathepsin A) n=1 Tax=Phyllobacterium bourgognense TaxID=314236 RepID=A0A368Z4A9_9HYPH|nr:hypothetical protein [Phyllobacterium bourgognense]RCW87251.1 carboxypeptidase C (cathepsin A) [Phyllobacterium bourgognense]
MNFRVLLLFAALGLSACNGSGSSDSSTTATSTFDAESAAAQAKLDGLNADIGQKTAALTAAGTKLTETEQADAALSAKIQQGEEQLAGLLVAAAAKTGEVETASTTLKERRDELAGLEGPNGRIEILSREIADLEKTRDGLAGIKDGDPGEIARLKGDREDLEKRLLELKGDPNGANDEKRLGTIKLAEKELSARTNELTALTGDPKDPQKPGKIKLAMDTLATYEGTGGKIEVAKTELARLDKLKNDALEDTKTAKLEAVRIRSSALIETGQFAEAAKILEAAGLTTDGPALRIVEAFVKDGKIIEAAGELTKLAPRKSVAALYTRAGMDQEAYKLYAPPDFQLVDKTEYDGSAGAQLTAAVDEKPSVKRQKMMLNGKTFWYTASAGHLTAFAKSPEKQDPQASIFYTAYTRDDLPKEDRPVTFFFNGGPGASSIYLHLTSWAPKRLVIDAPKVKPEWADNPPEKFNQVDDKESLMDKTDLVFVDIIPGTGYSQAIAPNTNQSFWDVTADVQLSHRFIQRYVNYNQRQESPKYLYGESYAGGTRVPKLARAMEEAGEKGFDASQAGARTKVLTGVVFHSPGFYAGDNDAAMLPTTAMTAIAIKKITIPATTTLDVYAQELRGFMTDTYLPARASKKNVDISKYTGSSSSAAKDLLPDVVFNTYDARMYLLRGHEFDPVAGPRETPWYNIDFFEERAFYNAITVLLPRDTNYKATSSYINASWNSWYHPSAGAFESWKGGELRNGLSDIVAALGMNPSLKLLTVHGYYDTATPFYRTELDLKGVEIDPVKKTTLLDRIPVKNFEGGHMIYYSEKAREPLKRTLDEFYDAPPYGTGPTIVKALDLVTAAPVQGAPVPAVALH